MIREQTWGVLAEALGEITYEREVPPHLPYHRDPPGLDVLYESVRFRLLADEHYAVLFIYTWNPNTYGDGMRHTRHERVVPVATYHKQAWTRWVFDQILAIETHETTEWFKVDGVRVYAPHHGNGWDPYTFWPGHDIAEKSKAPGDD